jgi:hypothetical protein
MGKNSENFKKNLEEVKSFLSEKKQITTLAERAGVSTRTVYNVFNAESFEELNGIKLDVYRHAIKLVEEIKSLPMLAEEAINK